MDITTVVSIIAGILALFFGFIWEGGHPESLFEKTALLIVFGGTFAATAVSFPLSKLKMIPDALRHAFRKTEQDPYAMVDRIVDMATIARKEGVLALENMANELNDPFLRNGLLMVVDGTDPELTQQILELEIEGIERMREQQAKIFEAAGGFAPTMGIIGTVMGLIHVLSNLADPGSLGPSIAVAFTATLYGVASANLIYLPIASKIKTSNQEIVHMMELMLEGILALQAGENPQLIRKKLNSFMLLESENPRAKKVDVDAPKE
ncbi:motility protein A [Paenibacillus baekrokdamisoli]|uniref:Motility protein A n=1 Tax=Paenibacillus baekrokdamisoli TaxID=1712516 RepID=A0A3G9JM18_9BACL|nr:flagellar motor protein [Paenibacillus baekrokdamisoli]MBB3073319.1 chemotaxis protein MotA [Paenibacillus baekrokdamisoli]BBH23944.1 motility protein A [Paenibacillus baekrokdamisoli]